MKMIKIKTMVRWEIVYPFSFDLSINDEFIKERKPNGTTKVTD
jgi:hypothetical protein